jgi:hypothetical protein
MLKIMFNYIHLYRAGLREIEELIKQLEMFHGARSEGFTAAADYTLFTFSNENTDIYLYIHNGDE